MRFSRALGLCVKSGFKLDLSAGLLNGSDYMTTRQKRRAIDNAQGQRWKRLTVALWAEIASFLDLPSHAALNVTAKDIDAACRRPESYSPKVVLSCDFVKNKRISLISNLSQRARLIQHLHLRHPCHYHARRISGLRDFTRLKTVTIEGCAMFPSELLTELSKLQITTLKLLPLHLDSYDTSDLAKLKSLPLTALDISGVQPFHESLVAFDITRITHLTILSDLSDEESLVALASLPSLKRLTLTWPVAHNAGVGSLSALPLTSLFIQRIDNEFGLPQMQTLALHPTLTSLSFDYSTRLTDQMLEGLAGSVSLRALKISGAVYFNGSSLTTLASSGLRLHTLSLADLGPLHPECPQAIATLCQNFEFTGHCSFSVQQIRYLITHIRDTRFTKIQPRLQNIAMKNIQ